MSESESPKPPSKKPISEKQLAANRANAARSTGPRTPEGKVHSSQNARKHGFCSANFTVVRLEDLDEIAHLRADLIAVYQPVNSQELFALERMAMCQQDILRAARLQSGMFTSCMNESFGPEGSPTMPFREELVEGVEVTRALNRNFIFADGFQLLCRQGNSIPLFLRYQAQVERQYRRAVEEFERVKKLRPELPNEPILEDDQPAEPEENTAASPSPELSPNEPISPSGVGASAPPPPFGAPSEPPAPVPAAGPRRACMNNPSRSKMSPRSLPQSWKSNRPRARWAACSRRFLIPGVGQTFSLRTGFIRSTGRRPV